MILTTSPSNPSIQRGDVWRVRFDPTQGQEINKERPAVVMNIAGVGRLQLHIVVPITEWQQGFIHDFWKIKLVPTSGNGLSKDSAADAFQVKSVSENRLVKKLGMLTPAQLDDIAAAIALCVGYTP